MEEQRGDEVGKARRLQRRQLAAYTALRRESADPSSNVLDLRLQLCIGVLPESHEPVVVVDRVRCVSSGFEQLTQTNVSTREFERVYKESVIVRCVDVPIQHRKQ